MKSHDIRLRFIGIILSALFFISCSETKSIANSYEKYYIGGVEGETKITTRSTETDTITYTSISEVGEINSSGNFNPSFKFLNKKVKVPFKDDATFTIGAYDILESNNKKLKYLIIEGISFDTDINYTVAYPISTAPLPATLNVTHTCASADGVNICQECKFTRNENGGIKGCKCAVSINNNPLGACKHTVSTDVPGFIIID